LLLASLRSEAQEAFIAISLSRSCLSNRFRASRPSSRVSSISDIALLQATLSQHRQTQATLSRRNYAEASNLCDGEVEGNPFFNVRRLQMFFENPSIMEGFKDFLTFISWFF
jgi:hypothetical protein